MNPERYDFIRKLEKAEEKSFGPALMDEEGNAYFAIKVKNKYGCVYVEVGKDLQARVINYMDMFDSCKCEPGTVAKALASIPDIDAKRKAALEAYNVFESKLSKAKKAKGYVANVLLKAYKWINSGKLSNEAMSLIGQAIKSIKSGNASLAKKLDRFLTDQGEPDNLLIQVTSEDIVNMIRREIGNMASVNKQNHGESYVFAGFYF